MMLERIIALFLLVVTLPLQLALWVVIRCTSRGAGLYASIRLGRNRRPIRVWKFRSMKVNTALETITEIHENEEWQSYRKLKFDPRITPVGKWLRRFSLDELPQLWNVVNGTMSFVGPRPIVHSENKLYGKNSVLIHSVKPGITGLWQVSGRNLTTYHRRIALNIYYVKNRSWKLDLWILYKTIWTVIGGRGAF